MEAGRAMLRGFVTPERTTLIASSHRIFGILEKSAMSDGRANHEKVHTRAAEQANAFSPLIWPRCQIKRRRNQRRSLWSAGGIGRVAVLARGIRGHNS